MTSFLANHLTPHLLNQFTPVVHPWTTALGVKLGQMMDQDKPIQGLLYPLRHSTAALFSTTAWGVEKNPHGSTPNTILLLSDEDQNHAFLSTFNNQTVFLPFLFKGNTDGALTTQIGKTLINLATNPAWTPAYFGRHASLAHSPVLPQIGLFKYPSSPSTPDFVQAHDQAIFEALDAWLQAFVPYMFNAYPNPSIPVILRGRMMEPDGTRTPFAATVTLPYPEQTPNLPAHLAAVSDWLTRISDRFASPAGVDMVATGPGVWYGKSFTPFTQSSHDSLMALNRLEKILPADHLGVFTSMMDL